MTRQPATPHHPHQLLAVTAAWSLTDARAHLAAAVAGEAAAARSDSTIGPSPIQAWRPSVGRGSGGSYGDPAGRAAVDTLEPDTANRRLAASTTGTLDWLATALRLAHHTDALVALTDAAPTLRPSTAGHLWRWLADADQRIRDRLGLDPDGTLLPGRRCPRCARRQLHAHTRAPRPLWTVTCTADCLCVGDACPCAMPVRLVDVPHIWGPDHPFVAGLTAAA